MPVAAHTGGDAGFYQRSDHSLIGNARKPTKAHPRGDFVGRAATYTKPNAISTAMATPTAARKTSAAALAAVVRPPAKEIA